MNSLLLALHMKCISYVGQKGNSIIAVSEFWPALLLVILYFAHIHTQTKVVVKP